MTKFFVVAEIGVGWFGSFRNAELLINNSKKAGADAVKFQAFLPEHVEDSNLLKSAVTKENASSLKDLADKAGIEWFCTSFYPEAVEFLDPLVRIHKIREKDSRELIDKGESKLLDAMLKTNKEVFISVQRRPITPLFLTYHPSITWLYCVPKYPPEPEEIDFGQCTACEGYSNHYPSLVAPFTAAVMGATAFKTFVIEVHVGWGPDKKVSLSFPDLERLTGYLRVLEKLVQDEPRLA